MQHVNAEICRMALQKVASFYLCVICETINTKTAMDEYKGLHIYDTQYKISKKKKKNTVH